MKAYIRLLSFIFFTAVIFGVTPYAALAQYSSDPAVTLYKSDITIQKDGSLLVDEVITIDFANEQHHGFIRNIPLQYKGSWAEQLNLRFELQHVGRFSGNESASEVPVERSYPDGSIELKVGDADTYLTGVQTYELVYTIQRAFAFQQPEHDEIYWNITGDTWDLPIEKVEATVHSPFSFKPAEEKATCYSGAYGNAGKDCSFEIGADTITYKSTQPLGVREGLTLVAGFPKGYFIRPSIMQETLWFLQDNWGLFLPIPMFVFFFNLWWKRGRDPSTGRDTIMPEYKPPEGLTPAEAGTILDERLDMQDISATIIDLAVRGYIKITETEDKKLFFSETSHEFELLKSIDNEELQSYEKEILKAFFGIYPSIKATCSLATLKNSFYQYLPAINKNVYASVVKNGYFQQSPEQVRNIYAGVGIAFIALPIFLFGFFMNAGIAITLPVGLVVSGLIILAFSRIMPARTTKGVEMRRRILGLEEFIRTAEKDRLAFQEKENIFEKILPYALALGVAEKWAKVFDGLSMTQPSWYQGGTGFGPNFSTYIFIRHMQQLNRNMNTVFQSAPRSYGSRGAWSGSSGFGGGFSGGGFGGGGGRLW